MVNKGKIVISAINFFEGGPLSVLKDCLSYINDSRYATEYTFIALVHKTELFDKNQFKNIEFIPFPKSRSSYIYRLYYEYFYFKKFARVNDVSFWLSLHDISPSLKNIRQAVYCHNPSPFNSINYADIYIQPTQFLFRLFYKYLYRINIHKNKYVIVQQLWMKNKFIEMFHLNKNEVIVAPPEISKIPNFFFRSQTSDIKRVTTFFFPTFPRPFKNLELLGKAAKLVRQRNADFKIIITIDGSENKYAQSIYNQFKSVKNIEFVGLINRDEVYEQYSLADCLIFPSKLETWGLPISEFKQFGKPILASNLPYAREAVGDYEKVNFFDPKNPLELAELMLKFLDGSLVYDGNSSTIYDGLHVKGWDNLFKILLND